MPPPPAAAWTPSHGGQDLPPETVGMCYRRRAPEVTVTRTPAPDSSHPTQVLAPALATANKHSPNMAWRWCC